MFIAAPVSAFTINSVDVTIDERGNADLTAKYSLTWAEKMAAFFGIVKPADELKKALHDLAPGKAELKSVTDSAVSVTYTGFVTVEGNTYTTPTVNLTSAEETLKVYVKEKLQYDWFINMVTSTDLAPGITKITFPDGYTETYYRDLVIPSVSHTVI